MDTNSSAMMNSAFAGGFILSALIVIAAFAAITVWIFWRIFAKAGYNGALGFLCLIPAGQVICLLILAFGTWPNDRQMAASSAVTPFAG